MAPKHKFPWSDRIHRPRGIRVKLEIRRSSRGGGCSAFFVRWCGPRVGRAVPSPPPQGHKTLPNDPHDRSPSACDARRVGTTRPTCEGACRTGWLLHFFAGASRRLGKKLAGGGASPARRDERNHRLVRVIAMRPEGAREGAVFSRAPFRARHLRASVRWFRYAPPPANIFPASGLTNRAPYLCHHTTPHFSARSAKRW